MKKILLLLIVGVLSSFSLLAQQKGSMSFLDKDPSFGKITLGDSITKTGYMRIMSPFKTTGSKGNLICKVGEPEDESFKIGDISPIDMFVNIKEYIIKDLIIYYDIDNEDIINEYITSKYGKYNRIKEGERLWIGEKFCILTSHEWNEKKYCLSIFPR